MTHIEVKRLDPRAIIPTRAHTTDAGADIHALEDVTLDGLEVKIIRTGIALNTPEGYWTQVEGRSSLASQGIFPIGGIIDEEYTGEAKIILANISATPYTITAGDKIAQLITRQGNYLDYREVEEFSTQGQRGDKGFGSSGA